MLRYTYGGVIGLVAAQGYACDDAPIGKIIQGGYFFGKDSRHPQRRQDNSAANADALEEVIEEIDQLERSEIAEIRYLEYEHHYAGFVGTALALIGASALLSGTVLRRLP